MQSPIRKRTIVICSYEGQQRCSASIRKTAPAERSFCSLRLARQRTIVICSYECWHLIIPVTMQSPNSQNCSCGAFLLLIEACSPKNYRSMLLQMPASDEHRAIVHGSASLQFYINFTFEDIAFYISKIKCR